MGGGLLFFPFVILFDFRGKMRQGIKYVLACYILLFAGVFVSHAFPSWILWFIPLLVLSLLVTFVIYHRKKNKVRGANDTNFH